MTDRIPKFVIMAGTQINWSVFQSFTQQVLERSLTETLDKYNVDPYNYGGFAACLNEMVAPGLKPNEGMNQFLAHLSFTVLGVCYEQDINDICPPGSSMQFTYTYSQSHTHILFVMSGNLDDWRTRIICGLLKKIKLNPYSIFFFNKMYEHISNQDSFGTIFQDYVKTYDNIAGFPSLWLLEKR